MKTRRLVAAISTVLFVGAASARAQDAGSRPAAPAGAGSAATATPPAQSAARRGFFDEPRIIGKALDFAERLLGADGNGGSVKRGFYPETGNMVTGAGWLSIGPGYRYWLFDDRAFVDASAGISWRAYKMAQARVEVPDVAGSPVTVGTQLRWQDYTQVTYFGEGEDSLAANRTEYRMKASNVAAYTTVRLREWLSIDGRAGWLTGPELLPPAGAFTRGNPGTHELFPDDPVYAFAQQPDFVYGEVAVAADTRDARGYPTRGGLYRAAWSNYVDQGAGRFSFSRYEAEGTHFMPFADSNIVVALHGWLVGTVNDPDQHVPFYLMPSLGGANTLRSYTNYRFHDRNLAVVSAETRFAIFEHVDAAVFADAGNVAARVADLNFEKTSYGFGIRVHARQSTVARLDIAHGAEGWQVLFRTNDPFQFSRLTKRTAPIPFAP